MPEAFLAELDDALGQVEELDEGVENDKVTAQLDLEKPPLVDEQAIEEEFMADFTQTDFDALLNELAEPEPLDADEEQLHVDFDALLADEDIQDVETPTEGQAIASEDFVDIESLLEQSDDAELENEPYEEINMDVGLGDFEEFLAGENAVDVDTEEGGFSAKLDLARAYLEIGDLESAAESIQDVLDNGPDSLQAEADQLLLKTK
ncbi:FimV/HubP family polar landmark protein [Pseudoalteromonas xiamenensis]